MNIHHPNAEVAAKEYIGTDHPLIELGWGVEGVVFTSVIPENALKVHSRQEPFEAELAVYRRLARHHVSEIQGFTIPRLIAFDTRLRILEMSIVKPPFLLDFAQSSLDKPPDFPEGLDEWWDRLRERFGQRFPIVESVFNELVYKYRIYYWDLKPGNIEFED